MKRQAEKIPPSQWLSQAPSPEVATTKKKRGWTKPPVTLGYVRELVSAKAPLSAEHLAIYLSVSKKTISRMADLDTVYLRKTRGKKDGRLPPPAIRNNKRFVRWTFRQYAPLLGLEIME